jgi:exosortase
MTQTFSTPDRARKLFPLIPLALLSALLLWAYWSTLVELAQHWSADPQYSHGYLVPGFAAVLLWLRRRQLDVARLRPSVAWGLGVLAAATAVRLVAGTHFFLAWLDPVSILPALAGVCLLAGGRAALRWAWPAVAFLFFMIPLPYSISLTVAGPLQTVATQASTYALQTLGRPALAEGHVILLNEFELGIVEACSGLRMLVVFFALATALALVIRRPLWEKLVVVASAVPIALLVNILRITATGVLYEIAGKELGEAVFHDLAGWVMMPVALLLLGLELKLLRHLTVDPDGRVGPVQPAAPAAPRTDLPAVAAPPRRSRRAAARAREGAIARPFAKS